MKTHFCFLLLVLFLATGCKLTCEMSRMFPSAKPKCGPGERLVKVSDEKCEGTGYLRDFNCPKCKGCGSEFVPTHHDPYTNTTYGNWKTCSDCCGSGHLLHDLCRGKGWIWECQTSS